MAQSVHKKVSLDADGRGRNGCCRKHKGSHQGKDSGEVTGSRAGVRPALAEERKQNPWGGMKSCDFPSSSTEGSIYLLGETMALEKMNQSPVT